MPRKSRKPQRAARNIAQTARTSHSTGKGRRRKTVGIVTLVGFFVAASAATLFWLRPFSPKNDVILIVLDTVRQDALGCYGNPRKPTPHIDALAADGVRFDEAISSSGWTLPAVASLLTGTWPVLHGGLGRNVTLTPIRDEIPTAAEVMAREGFRTLAVANAAFVSPMLHLDRGFDVFDHRYTYNWDTRRADESVDAALALLGKNRFRSNFLLLHLFDPHLDYDPPESYASKYTGGRVDPAPPITHGMCEEMRTNDGADPPVQADIDYIKAMYLAEIDFMDAEIGRLVSELKAKGRYEDATIIITADHGEEFWDHSGFEHGHTLYDELIRVPLIIKFPAGVSVQRRVVDTQVPTLDIMPTVFALLDIDKPDTFVGESMLPLVSGRPAEHRLAFSESTLYGDYMISLRGPRYKYIYNLSAGEAKPGELFDWRDDPLEARNLSAEHVELASGMHRELIGLYERLAARAKTMSKPEAVDLSPQRIDMLRSLGYIR